MSDRYQTVGKPAFRLPWLPIAGVASLAVLVSAFVFRDAWPASLGYNLVVQIAFACAVSFVLGRQWERR